jgi:hypothetical protein
MRRIVFSFVLILSTAALVTFLYLAISGKGTREAHAGLVFIVGFLLAPLIRHLFPTR